MAKNYTLSDAEVSDMAREAIANWDFSAYGNDAEAAKIALADVVKFPQATPFENVLGDKWDRLSDIIDSRIA